MLYPRAFLLSMQSVLPVLNLLRRSLTLAASVSLALAAAASIAQAQSPRNGLVSVTNVTVSSGAAASFDLSVSADGRRVAFTSESGNLTSNDSNHATDVFVRDRQTNTTILVSVNKNGTGPGDQPSNNPVITPDGRYVMFTSAASDLVTNDTATLFHEDVYVRDLQTNTTIQVSRNLAGTARGNNASTGAAISSDGRYVLFRSFATDLVPNDNNSQADIFVRDLQTNTTALVTINSAGTGSGNGNGSTHAVMTPDGRYVAFLSEASDLVANDTNNSARDVFVRDMQTSVTRLVSVNQAGTGSGNGSADPRSQQDLAISNDGRYVAFTSNASDLVPNDNNGTGVDTGQDVFVRDTQANTTTLVSVDSSGTASANNNSGGLSMTPDGRFVVFLSGANNLVANDSNSDEDVFVRDLVSSTTALVSVNQSNVAAGIGNTTQPFLFPSFLRPTLSSDGRFISFTSNATGMTATSDAATNTDVFVRDMQAGTTRLVSINFLGTNVGNGNSSTPVITPDGGHIVYESHSSNLVPNDVNEGILDGYIFVNLPQNGQVRFHSFVTTSDESTGKATVTVMLEGALGTQVSVDYTTFNGTAFAGVDFQFASGTIQFAPGETTKTFDITLLNDVLDEVDERFYIKLSNPSGAGAAPGEPSIAAVTIVDEDPQPSLSVDDAFFVEGNAGNSSPAFAVKLSAPSGRTVRVNVSTSSGTAQAGVDYSPRSGTITFLPGQTVSTINLSIIGDTNIEPDETFFVNLSNPDGATIADNQAQVTIIDDDTPTPVLKVQSLTVTEGDSGTTDAVVTVTLSFASSQTVTVNYQSFNMTAQAGVDYQSVSGMLTFAPGETSKTLTVPIIGDALNEPVEQFQISLSNPVNAAIFVSSNPPVVIIEDNDPAIQSEVKTWTLGGITYAYVKLTFADSSFGVADWGAVSVNGTDYSANATVNRTSGPSIQTVVTTANIYTLGQLALGNYTFAFKVGGVTLNTHNFTVGVPTVPNQIDAQREFVRWQYKDFLGREPDQAGWDFWTDNITKCNDPARRPPGQSVEQCIDKQRVTTSGAFFLSPEFQYTGYYVYRIYKGALGRAPYFSEFTQDRATVGNGIVVNGQLSGAVINQNKANFAQQFVQRAEFISIYGSLSNQDYVLRLFQTTGVTPTAAERDALIAGLNNQTETRATVLFKIVDGINVISEGNQQFTTTYGQAFYNQQFNAAFVQMEYFGYMHRDPDAAGYAFWLGKLNTFGNYIDAEMVRSFIVSPEYRSRFGQP